MIIPKWWSRDQRKAVALYTQDRDWVVGYWLGNLKGCPVNGGLGEPAQPMLRQRSEGGDPCFCGAGWLHVSLQPLEEVVRAWQGQSLWVVAVKIAGKDEEKAWGKDRIIIGRILSADLPNDTTDLVKVRAGAFDLGNSELSYDDISYADLRCALLCDARLVDANLSGADLSGADLRYANLNAANLRYTNCVGADFRYATIRNANFSFADLTRADFSFADLTGVDFSSAIITGSLFLISHPSDKMVGFSIYAEKQG